MSAVNAFGFQLHRTAQQRWCFNIFNILLLRSISFRSERPSRVMAVLISHQQPSVTRKYQNVSFQKLRPTRRRSYVTLSCLATKQSELVTIPTRSKVCIRKVENVHSKYYKTTEKSFNYYFKP